MHIHAAGNYGISPVLLLILTVIALGIVTLVGVAA